jgi:hypothetical protein
MYARSAWRSSFLHAALFLVKASPWLYLRGQRPSRTRFQLDKGRLESLDYGTPRNGITRLSDRVVPGSNPAAYYVTRLGMIFEGYLSYGLYFSLTSSPLLDISTSRRSYRPKSPFRLSNYILPIIIINLTRSALIY